MTINEVMMRHNFLSKILLRDGDKELSRDLKVKLMSMRIEMGKVKRQLEEDLQEMVKGLTPEGYTELASKQSKTDEEKKQLEDWTNKINSEYESYVNSRGREEVALNNSSFTEDEFSEILEVNAGNDVEINGTKLNAADFLEIIYSLFVE